MRIKCNFTRISSQLNFNKELLKTCETIKLAKRTQVTYFADSVLIEPVTSISPARNNWYLVQAMLKNCEWEYKPPQERLHDWSSGFSFTGARAIIYNFTSSACPNKRHVTTHRQLTCGRNVSCVRSNRRGNNVKTALIYFENKKTFL